MDSALPATMHAWRKHRGIDEAIWEEVPVPSVPATGFLCKMLAAGVCHSDEAMIVDRSPRRPWFQETFTLVLSSSTPYSMTYLLPNHYRDMKVAAKSLPSERK
ncbi:hypothetical protein AC579_2800 [Pseudocercospora musae]|uniref:Uncharacterized protein n=1 Tax=Pseudocercospora musae TaxID=113226 RepID=A0A139IKX4_9PEZI|nr:hypothetical protein AC579_2800 [Pseudocercospora musae]KXT15295.1 hypothetical protein AC579_2800 [Pseudocercospora musae]